jgi:GntR family transcriptional repressor for pyruvate dehydrogenase complex
LVNVVKPQRQRVSELVCSEITEMITSKMKSGDRLPPESELSSMFNVGRSTIREALRVLESVGFVEKSGGGTYVSSSPKDCLVEPLSLMIDMKFAELSDIFQMRRILEIESVKLAVINAGKDDTLKLENIFWMMHKPDLTSEEFVELDKQFHYAIASATGNAVMYHFIKDINTVIAKFMDKLCSGLKDSRDVSLPQHKKTLDGILTKNVDLAVEGMNTHLLGSEEAASREYSVKLKMSTNDNTNSMSAGADDVKTSAKTSRRTGNH